MKVFIDTCIPMYAAGTKHPYIQSCQDILESVARGKLDAYTDADVFKEILHRYFNIDKKQVGLQVFDLFSKIMDRAILPVCHLDLLLARKFSKEESYSPLSPRDLVHLAVMLNNDISRIVTADPGFSRIPGIQIIRPSVAEK